MGGSGNTYRINEMMNDLFGGSNQGQPTKFDPRMAGIIVIVLLIGVMVMVGDAVAFKRLPQNIFESSLGIIPSLAFKVLDDRMYANAVAGGVYAAVIIVGGLWLVTFLERRIFKPQQVKKMLDEKRLEERIINDAEDKYR